LREGGLCARRGCQIISDGYALTAGTSMAAPMVSGAAALLLERQPQLEQGELRNLLLAGAAPLAVASDVASREGAGMLDVAGSLGAAAAPARTLDERPSSELSRLRAAAASAFAAADRTLSALLWLKDAEGATFDASPERLQVGVSGGELRSGPARVAPGLYEFAVAAPPPAPPSLAIDVAIDGEPLLSLALPIEGGHAPAPSARDDGGCHVSPRAPASSQGRSSWLAALLAAAAGARSRRAIRARSHTA
jgi:hypothetical protein